MGERGSPPDARIHAVERHRIAGADEACKPGAARVFGQMDDQIVPAPAQRSPEAQLSAQHGQTAALLEPAVDGVHDADCRVAIEHWRGLAIDQRIQHVLLYRARRFRPTVSFLGRTITSLRLASPSSAQDVRLDGHLRCLISIPSL